MYKLQELLQHGFFHTMIPNDPESLVMTNLEPYDKALMKSKEFVRALETRKEGEARHSGFDDLGSILQNSISAENFLGKFLHLNLGHFFPLKQTKVCI
jgi:hypothetical protein